MVAAALRLAQHAPSVHNTRPWRWHFDGERLHLFRDRDRMSADDPYSREDTISGGAVLHHDFPQILIRVGTSPDDGAQPHTAPRHRAGDVLTAL